MVRSGSKSTSLIAKIKNAKRKRAGVISKTNDESLNKKKISNPKNDSIFSCSNNNNNIEKIKVNPNDMNKPSKNFQHTYNVNKVSSDPSKNTDILIKKKVSQVSEEANISTNKNVSILQKTLEAHVPFPSKVVRDSKIVQNTPAVNNVPLLIERVRYNNQIIRIVSFQSLNSKSWNLEEAKQKDIETGFQKIIPKDKNKDTESINQQLCENKINYKNMSENQSRNVQNKNIECVALQKDLSTNSQLNDQKVNTQQNVHNEKNQLSIQQNDQSMNCVANIQQKDPSASNFYKFDNLQKIQNVTSEILNTKYFPIKPKPSNYEGSTQLHVVPYKKKLKRVRRDPEEIEKLAVHSCIVCGKKFTCPHNLLRHQASLHRVLISTGRGYECRVCGKSLATVQGRFKHERNIHPDRTINIRPWFKCSECLQNFKGKKSIKAHISNDHPDINLVSETITLNSLEEFDKWKEAIESDTGSQFIIKSNHNFESFKKIFFNCHRSSTANLSFTGTGKRKMKYKGSIKTGLFCPAFMIATISETNVKVTYNLTHLGHECDVEHVSMQKRVKSDQNCKLLRCRICNKVFSNSTNRRKHERTFHGIDVKYELTLKCPLCFHIFPTRKAIMHHFSKSHSEIHLNMTNVTFKSLKEFYNWKSVMEQETNSEYVLDQAYYKNILIFRRFNCHLSGSGENELFCPASLLLKITQNEENVDVFYTSTHIGHSDESLQTISLEIDSMMSECISIKDSHKVAEQIFKFVNVIKKDENTWNVLPLKNENCIYEVTKLHVDCTNDCKLKCFSCNFCCHQFTCNCSLSALKLMCVHIHIVCLKNIQLNEEDISDISCTDFDMNFYEDENRNELENNVLQETTGSPTLNNLKDQALFAISTLITEVRNCNDEAKLKSLISSLSNLKNKITSKKRPVQKKSNFLQNKKLKTHLTDNQNNVLERVIEVTLNLENENSTYI